MITLQLPYPISSNKYWRPVHIGNHITIVPTKDAKKYKETVGWIARAQGIHAPIVGRVSIDIKLYPNRPQDFKKRMRDHGDAWDDTVMCIDLDNANKVLLDSLKGIAIEDDKWVRKLTGERMEPDGEARVIVTIDRYIREENPQKELLIK
jgi:crossover junction endodeoxyribonuclease RusA